ncbi:hypothetical protein OFN94_40090, partial [Escherichia coli]|nr:hypothetical protein [Escherichia coli]
MAAVLRTIVTTHARRATELRLPLFRRSTAAGDVSFPPLPVEVTWAGVDLDRGVAEVSVCGGPGAG